MAHLEKVARVAERLFITVAKTFPNFPRKDNGRVSTSLHNSFLTLIEKYESAINLKYVRERRLAGYGIKHPTPYRYIGRV